MRLLMVNLRLSRRVDAGEPPARRFHYLKSKAEVEADKPKSEKNRKSSFPKLEARPARLKKSTDTWNAGFPCSRGEPLCRNHH